MTAVRQTQVDKRQVLSTPAQRGTGCYRPTLPHSTLLIALRLVPSYHAFLGPIPLYTGTLPRAWLNILTTLPC